MWSTLVAIVILVIFASFFVKIRFSIGRKTNATLSKCNSNNNNDTSKYNEEQYPPSSADAKYLEIRHEFIQFAKFFLLERRPYGYNDMAETFMDKKTPGIDGYNVMAPRDLGKGRTSTSLDCYNQCKANLKCNAWKYKDDQTCIQYNVSGLDSFTKVRPGANNYQVGYIFRPDDSWAVKDLSGLPTSLSIFKKIAQMVIRFQCKDLALSKRARHIIDSSTVKYCYETNPIQDEEMLEEYITKKNNALKRLEQVCLYFLFPESKINYKILEGSMACARILETLNLGGKNGDIFKDYPKDSNFIKGLQKAILVYTTYDTDYENARRIIDTYDIDQSGYITREEYKMYLENNNHAKNQVDCQKSSDFKESCGVDGHNCLGDTSIDEEINNFFDKYDTNPRNGTVSITDILGNLSKVDLTSVTKPKCTEWAS